ncbi:MAG: hypothetical protein G01um10148_791 [Parcubacteria group bacterium Gr01-1014_8]|nr:MAG: hypothetical protein G01um10148_791 [Parcubacteria group bacterium Gr01-1014_8]
MTKIKQEPESELEPPANLYFPRLSLGPSLAHYHGDHVRRLFIAAAGAMLVLAPFLSSYMPYTLPFEILGAVVIVVLAALTNPKKEMVMMANAFAAGIGVVANETIALFAYFDGSIFIFFGREVIAFLFIFALYFSLKTVRAMELGQIGKREPPGEFREPTLEEMWEETHHQK